LREVIARMFRDRRDAGVQLATRLSAYKDVEGVLVLALPRGGVITGYEIARRLRVPFDTIIVRKIGLPGQPELAVGAVSERGIVILNDYIISAYGVSKRYVETEIERESNEIARRVDLYRKGEELLDVKGKTVILVDDGVATGATIKATIRTLRKAEIKKLIVALPVAPPDEAREIEKLVDEFICLKTPTNFIAVGAHYVDFGQVSDKEVVELLEENSFMRRSDESKG
jgi:putative phosphoribosyl transferase